MKVLVVTDLDEAALVAEIETAGMFQGITPTSVVTLGCPVVEGWAQRVGLRVERVALTDGQGGICLQHYDAIRACEALILATAHPADRLRHLANVAWRYFRPSHIGPAEIDQTQPAMPELDLFS